MTTIDSERLARGWSLIAEGAMEIGLAYSAFDPAAARAAGGPGATGAPAIPPLSSAPVPSFDELPPVGFDVPAPMEEARLNPQVEAGLGKCPVHGKPWSVKAAGVSKAGAPYDAFYKCDSKDGDEFCKQKPQKIWRDLHPIPNGVAA